eukprot:2732994-Prymnesium_polylepis.1
MEVEAQVAHFLRFCRPPEVRARTRASGRQQPALLLPPTPNVLTSAFRSAFLRDCPARRPRRRDGHRS